MLLFFVSVGSFLFSLKYFHHITNMAHINRLVSLQVSSPHVKFLVTLYYINVCVIPFISIDVL